MRLFKKLRRKLGYLDETDIDRIHEAYVMAFEGHRHQKRINGEAYITHPISVAIILAEMRLDAQTIIAAILHDLIEDTSITKADIEAKFGLQVANLVDGVSKLTQIEFVSRAQEQAENFRKMLLAMSRDIRVILVKLADRLHNMRTLGALRPEKRHRIAKETLEIFAPVAKRLGMRDLSVELEELGFAGRHERRHAILSAALKKARGNRKKVLSHIEKTLREGIQSSSLPHCELSGREKHLYSIYRKMKVKRMSFNEIMDVYAFRILTQDIDTCYRVLGLVHQLYKPLPERFKDYIAIPKANGYQSLHTTLFGPYGLPIEIQIRTRDMDRVATSGIAAHWLYKLDDEDIDRSQFRAQKWVENLLELQNNNLNSLEFIESVKVDLFPDEVYIFTPQGKIIGLPGGSTAVDFAYSVHTDVGNSCVAVKIDRKLSPLSTVLRNGQTVEVITSERAKPNPVWLDFVVTSKARSAIRQFIKSRQRVESVELGKQLLQKAIKERGLLLRRLPNTAMNKFLSEIRLDKVEDLYSDLGLGNRVPALVAERLSVIANSDGDLSREEEVPIKPLSIKGTEGMLVSYATCCSPIPGDPIVSVLNKGKGIVVHVDRCRRLNKLRQSPEKLMPLRWSDHLSRDFMVSLTVDVENKRGILAVMALAVSDADANIEDIRVDDRDGRHYLVVLKVTVKDRAHLSRVMRSLRRISAVREMKRTSS